MFAEQDYEAPEGHQFGTEDIYLPELSDLQAQDLSVEGMQVICGAAQQNELAYSAKT